MSIFPPLERREVAPVSTAASPSEVQLTALLDAVDRMHAEHTVDDLWQVLADEAAGVLGRPAAVLRWNGHAWDLLASTPVDGNDSWADHVRLDATVPTESNGSSDSSVLVKSIDGAGHRVPLRLAWMMRMPAGSGDWSTLNRLATLFTRHASRAVRNAMTRHSLSEAIAARHRVGQAQGILMVRYGVSTERAFDILRRRSQTTNVKLRTIAERVIRTGDLAGPDQPAVPAPRPSPGRRS